MQALALLSMVVVALVTGVVGFRLLLVWRRTRQLPELCFGIGLLGGSVGSAAPQIGQRVLWTQADAFAGIMNGAGFAILCASTVALLVCTWRVFRPAAPWAGGLVLLGSAVTATSFGMRVANGELAAAQPGTDALLIFFSCRLLLFAWTSFESLRYYAMLRRRVALGLAEATVAQQILFWGIAGVSTLGVSIAIWVAIFVLEIHPLERAASIATITFFSIVTSVSMWCAFFPPAWLRRRAEHVEAVREASP